MIIKTKPDLKKAQSILEMAELIEERIKPQDKTKFSTLVISDYYEIIKELATAFLLIDGYKTLSHRDLIDYLKNNCKEITTSEILLLDNLRILRNRITYEGFRIPRDYLASKEDVYLAIIKKLKLLVKNKLK